jgi:hypothetical protein
LNWSNIEVFGKTIYGFDKQNLYKYSPPLPDVTSYSLPEELQDAIAVKIANHRIYILKNGTLSVYSLP